VDHTILLLVRTPKLYLISVFIFALGRKNQISVTTAVSTVRPAEEKGYNRVLPGRTESEAFSQ
jgi:hypothetical protein